jgi:hypothetical protein
MGESGGGGGGGGEIKQDNGERSTGGRGGWRQRGQQQNRHPWVDGRDPKIVAMMADYVAEHGLCIRLVDILNACNKRITDLPTLPDYIDNRRPYVCWAHIHGSCTFNDCQFKRGHVLRRAITDGFADAVIAMLTPGVQACVNGGGGEGSRGKRQKVEGNQA